MNFALPFLASAHLAFAQTSAPPASDAATIQALLVEVRQLRLALEKSAMMAPRIQLTLQRIQMQQDSVTRASRDLDEIREKLSQASLREAELNGRVQSFESQVNSEQDPVRKKQFELDMRAMKSAIEQEGSIGTQLRAREADIAGRLQLEQGKLNELNDRLNALERALEQPRQP